MRKLTLLLLAILAWLQYSLWLGKNGVEDYIRVQDNIVILQQGNDVLKSRNQQLIAEIKNLTDGSEAIEERARDELGMIKPNEQFYRIIPERPHYNITQ